MSFQTDLNQRERRRYAEQARTVATAYNEMADALEAEDDTTVITSFLIGSMTGVGLNRELGQAITDAAKVAKASADLDRFEP